MPPTFVIFFSTSTSALNLKTSREGLAVIPSSIISARVRRIERTSRGVPPSQANIIFCGTKKFSPSRTMAPKIFIKFFSLAAAGEEGVGVLERICIAPTAADRLPELLPLSKRRFSFGIFGFVERRDRSNLNQHKSVNSQSQTNPLNFRPKSQRFVFTAIQKASFFFQHQRGFEPRTSHLSAAVLTTKPTR